ncbi:hypothetical protein GE09DRAFT_1213998 [Coniochaeta sp. 2T2.1]|nr:hypothetical protein GE09DRAFT_1213998 [Coniochaeta sp. 2T2.1]
MSSPPSLPGSEKGGDDKASRGNNQSPKPATTTETDADADVDDGTNINQQSSNLPGPTTPRTPTTQRNQFTESTTSNLRRFGNGYVVDAGSSFNLGPPGFDPSQQESPRHGLDHHIKDLLAAPRAPLPHLLEPLMSGRHPLPTGRPQPTVQQPLPAGEDPVVPGAGMQSPATTGTGKASAKGKKADDAGDEEMDEDDEDEKDMRDRASKKARKD